MKGFICFNYYTKYSGYFLKEYKEENARQKGEEQTNTQIENRTGLNEK